MRWTNLAPIGATIIVTGTNTKNPGKLTYPKLKGAFTVSKNTPLKDMLIAPKNATKNPKAEAVPIAILIGYPNSLIAGTPKDPAPIPKGTEKKPNPTPIITLKTCDIGFGLLPTFSLKKIKNKPTKKAKKEKNNIKGGVFKLDAKIVPRATPRTIKIPKDFINLKSTALNFIWVLADIIEVGIIIANEVPKAKCILVAISKSITVKA